MKPHIVGHRGARGEMPENSLEGCLFLKALKIHRVEMDAHLSRDGHIMIIHDATLNRTTQNKGYVNKKNSAHLIQMRIKAQDNQWPYPVHIPSLSTILAHWPELKSMQLELKKIPLKQLPSLADRLYEITDWYPNTHNIVLTSQFPYIISYLKRKKVPYKMGLVNIPHETDHFTMAKQLGCRYLISHHSMCHQSYLKKAHKKGFKVSTWTVNDFDTYDQLCKLKHLDSIITDVPSIMQGWQQLN